MKKKGTLYIIAAPSGGGKTSLVNALLETLPNITVSISHTTRAIRPGEKEGVNYHFVDQKEFDRLVNAGIFLEHATVFGNSYGTSREWVNNELAKGIDVILEIDWQGAEQVKRLVPDAVSIFILPPSLASLEERLRARQQDPPDVIAKRMAKAQDEIAHSQAFDFIVLNDDFASALRDLQTIITKRQLIRENKVKVADLLKELLEKSKK